MNKIISVIAIVVIVIVGIVWYKSANAPAVKNDVVNTDMMMNTGSTTSNTNENMASTSMMASSTNMMVKTYTISDVALHKTSTNCWTTISGEVFDLTTWIKQHPGGDKAILSICGIDGTKAFEGQHGGKAKVEMKLETFKIGNLSSK